MRLIDADELLFVLERYSDIIVPSEAGVQAVNLKTVQHLVTDIPTAYDIDKVVEQLEEMTDKPMELVYDVLLINHIIEIVKGGAK